MLNRVVLWAAPPSPIMQIEVTSRSPSIPALMRSLAETRLAGVERFGEDFEKGEVILSYEHEEFICELILHRHRGEPIVATETCREGRAAIDGAASKLERQFLRFKETHSHKGRRKRPEN